MRSGRLRRRPARDTRARTWTALIAVLVAATGTAGAAPKGNDARAQFDRGVAAYTRGDYVTAAEALGASFVLEADPETLFAWAQTERKLGKCDRAIELYTKLLAMDLPAENKQAISVQIDECKQVLAEAEKTKPPPAPEPTPPPAPEPVPSSPERRSWWKDPVGGALVGAGVVGLGLGTVFLVQARAADSDKASAMTYPEYEALDDRAVSRGRLGVIAAVSGAVLVGAGVVWYVTRERGEALVTGFVAPSGGGLAVAGWF